MHLQLTKKTNEWLKQDFTTKDTDNDMYAWHVNYEYAAGKRFVILMHDLSRYTIVLYGVKKKEMIDPDFIFNAIFHAMLEQQYDESLVLKYLNAVPTNLTFNKTKNNTLVSRMNRSMSDALWKASHDGLVFDYSEQLHITKDINEVIVGENHFKVTYIPKEKMMELLKLMFE